MRELQTRIPRNKVIRDRYVIEELLGQGGFGAVYRVRDRRVKGNVFALKEISNPNRNQRESFLFEGELLRRLDHPALPRVYRVFEDNKSNRLCTLMDYIAGLNLERLRLRQPEKRFSLAQVLHMLAPIRNALLYLHAQQPPIIHRDIKPSNIIIPPDEDAVLVDFGIAKEYEEDSTTTAIRHCSPGYGAPEQYVSGTSTQTDIYGLGATIYTLLTGSVPIDALYRLTRLSVKHEDPLLLAHELAPDVSVQVSEILQRSMAINSADRYASIAEFWQLLVAAAPDDAPSTDPVADLRSPAVARTSQTMAAVIAASAITQADHHDHTSEGRAPVVTTGSMVTDDPAAEHTADSIPLVAPDQAVTDPLPTPAVHILARSAAPLSHDRSRVYAYSLLTLALLLLIIAGSLGAYVYAGAYSNGASTQQRSRVTPVAHAHATVASTAAVRPTATVAPTSAPATPTSVPAVVTVPATSVSTQTAATPAPTQAPATPIATLTPQPAGTGNFPVLAAGYGGSIHNTPANVDTSLNLSQLRQTQGTLTGYLSLGPGLIGAGSFHGSVTQSSQVSFLVASTGAVLPLFFEGQIHGDGSMAGSYCSYQNNSCDHQAGGYGTWTVAP
jgi:Serine/threonine protein kinase